MVKHHLAAHALGVYKRLNVFFYGRGVWHSNKILLNYNHKADRHSEIFCKTPPFAQFLRQTQILILKILNVFLWLKFSPFLNLNEIGHFSKVSFRCKNFAWVIILKFTLLY